ncbi:DNA cytosine methyltransferase [Thalassospiraceae bacterium LMO-JJ14]|nr:DNA cytosine methyltransferase [Thalassospiraceae bacterium LMO-JJ14]
MLLSLFAGAGGMDLGFEQSGFKIPVAYDINADSIASYNYNRAPDNNGYVADIRKVTLKKIDSDFGGIFKPIGIIGGSPCQSFSKANRSAYDPNDPRHSLPLEYVRVLRDLNNRNPVHFLVFENVTCFSKGKHEAKYNAFIKAIESAGFAVSSAELNAVDFGIPQKRKRLIVVGINRSIYSNSIWESPEPSMKSTNNLTVKNSIGRLKEPMYFKRGIDAQQNPEHPNHWCMNPVSSRFHTPGALRSGDSSKRSFKVLDWNKPSLTVAYGNREVHVHPNCHRRLSVYEAMLLQGFPNEYQLLGTLSSQIDQVSEAVPPPLAKAIADSISEQFIGPDKAKDTRQKSAA